MLFFPFFVGAIQASDSRNKVAVHSRGLSSSPVEITLGEPSLADTGSSMDVLLHSDVSVSGFQFRVSGLEVTDVTWSETLAATFDIVQHTYSDGELAVLATSSLGAELDAAQDVVVLTVHFDAYRESAICVKDTVVATGTNEAPSSDPACREDLSNYLQDRYKKNGCCSSSEGVSIALEGDAILSCDSVEIWWRCSIGCTTDCVEGCRDEEACNFDATAGVHDAGACLYLDANDECTSPDKNTGPTGPTGLFVSLDTDLYTGESGSCLYKDSSETCLARHYTESGSILFAGTTKTYWNAESLPYQLAYAAEHPEATHLDLLDSWGDGWNWQGAGGGGQVFAYVGNEITQRCSGKEIFGSGSKLTIQLNCQDCGSFASECAEAQLQFDAAARRRLATLAVGDLPSKKKDTDLKAAH